MGQKMWRMRMKKPRTMILLKMILLNKSLHRYRMNATIRTIQTTRPSTKTNRRRMNVKIHCKIRRC